MKPENLTVIATTFCPNKHSFFS